MIKEAVWVGNSVLSAHSVGLGSCLLLRVFFFTYSFQPGPKFAEKKVNILHKRI